MRILTRQDGAIVECHLTRTLESYLHFFLIFHPVCLYGLEWKVMADFFQFPTIKGIGVCLAGFSRRIWGDRDDSLSEGNKLCVPHPTGKMMKPVNEGEKQVHHR